MWGCNCGLHFALIIFELLRVFETQRRLFLPFLGAVLTSKCRKLFISYQTLLQLRFMEIFFRYLLWYLELYW